MVKTGHYNPQILALGSFRPVIDEPRPKQPERYHSVGNPPRELTPSRPTQADAGYITS